MTSLWLPPSARDTGEKLQAEVHSMVERFEGVMRYWTETLQRELNDPRLEVVFAPPYVDAETGLAPGRYNVIRYNDPPAPLSIIPVEGLRGEFVEPGQWLVEKLRRSDLQNPQLTRQRDENLRKSEASQQRAKDLEAEQRQDLLKESLKARTQASISLNRDVPWTQNVRGRRVK